jgi:hypothetical protein
MRKPYYQQQA